MCMHTVMLMHVWDNNGECVCIQSSMCFWVSTFYCFMVHVCVCMHAYIYYVCPLLMLCVCEESPAVQGTSVFFSAAGHLMPSLLLLLLVIRSIWLRLRWQALGIDSVSHVWSDIVLFASLPSYCHEDNSLHFSFLFIDCPYFTEM